MSKWTFRQIEPQPARGVLREEMWDSPDWIAEEKYDGDRRIAQFCGKVVRFTGRRKSVKDGLFVEKTENVPHLSGMTIAKAIWKNGKPPTHPPPAALEGTVLDGEMIAAPQGTPYCVENGGQSKYVTSIMGSLPEEAIRKQIERGWLRYVVFDCLFYKGKDIRGESYTVRRAAVINAVGLWNNPFVVGSEISAGRKHPADTRGFYESIVRRGGEGIILKHLNHRYGDKTLWVKVKKQATADVVIMGFIPAKEMSVKKGDDKATLTKYAKAGLIGAIQCGQWYRSERAGGLWEVATVSGMTDDLRRRFTLSPRTYKGRVITIEHNGREPTGRFRHPRLADNTDPFRIDKSAKDCVYREDES